MIECPTCERIGTPPAFVTNSGTLREHDQVVENLCARVFAQGIERDERGYGASVDQLALLVDDEHAVRVAVEGDAEVALMFEHRSLQVAHVLRLDRTCRMIRKRAVEFEKERNHFACQRLKDVRNGFARHAVAGVDCDLERCDLGTIDEGEAVFGELVEDIAFRDHAGRRCSGREVACDDLIANLCQPGVERDRFGPRTRKLHSVILCRIVRGCDHHAAVEAIFTDGKIERIGRDHPDRGHIGAGLGRTTRKRCKKAFPARPHIATYDDAFATHKRYKAASDGVGHVIVEL